MVPVVQVLMNTIIRTALLCALAGASPAFAWDAPQEMVGAYALARADARPGAQACELELLPAQAREFEGVWYVARPLHYEPNRDACRLLGIDDAIAWGSIGTMLVLLAEGEAGLMEFEAGEDGWRLEKSSHQAPAALLLRRISGLE